MKLMANIFGQKPEGKKPQKRKSFRGRLYWLGFQIMPQEILHVRDCMKEVDSLMSPYAADLQRDEAVLFLWANVALGCK